VEEKQMEWRALAPFERDVALRLLARKDEKVRVQRLGNTYEGIIDHTEFQPLGARGPVRFRGRQLENDKPIGVEIFVWVQIAQISIQVEA